MALRPPDDAPKLHWRWQGQRGTALIEFAIVMTMLIPMFFGMVIFGISAGRAIQATQFTRDMGHLYAMGVDFSTASSQSLMMNLAQNLDVSSTGGVVIFSQIKKVYQADCDAQIMSTCPNISTFVFAHRLHKPTSTPLALPGSESYDERMSV